jgi:hypothetical protein
MTMVDVTFACGHRISVRDGQPPVCVCGEARKRAVHTPPPRFRGTVSGPLAVTEALAPAAIPLVAPKE